MVQGDESVRPSGQTEHDEHVLSEVLVGGTLSNVNPLTHSVRGRHVRSVEEEQPASSYSEALQAVHSVHWRSESPVGGRDSNVSGGHTVRLVHCVLELNVQFCEMNCCAEHNPQGLQTRSEVFVGSDVS
jgi:hypothetical protein